MDSGQFYPKASLRSASVTPEPPQTLTLFGFGDPEFPE